MEGVQGCLAVDTGSNSEEVPRGHWITTGSQILMGPIRDKVE